MTDIEKKAVSDEMHQRGICVIVPTYNNHATLLQVLERIRPLCRDIIVVNDGSTDATPQLLEQYCSRLKAEGQEPLEVVSYLPNRGKGHALKSGFRHARSKGYSYAVTIDSDGQHYPEDLPSLLACHRQHPDALIVGNRKLHQENMPGGNTFANYFSNFWFMVQTWQYLPDTQTGYRLYPLRSLHGLGLLTSRYEAELELLVLAAWHGTALRPSPIRVYYPPEGERVTHFRPFWDFFRISVLNTVLCVLCIIYGWWAMIFFRIVHALRK